MRDIGWGATPNSTKLGLLSSVVPMITPAFCRVINKNTNSFKISDRSIDFICYTAIGFQNFFFCYGAYSNKQFGTAVAFSLWGISTFNLSCRKLNENLVITTQK